MDLKSLIAKLHPLERTVIPVLKTQTELSAIISATGLQEVEVTRALQWLENKQVLKIHTEKKKVVSLDENGLRYKQQGLPEKAFLKILTADFQPLSQIAKKAKLNPEEVNACIGVLKRKVAIETRKDQELMVKLGPQGQKVLKEGMLEEKFLAQQFPRDAEKITDLNMLALEELRQRKSFIRIEEQKKITIELLPLGKQLLREKIEQNVVNRLTPEMLKTGSWKQQNFRAYDVEINVPKRFFGKKHFVTQAAEYAKKIWMEMGFKEMTGNMVQTSFWNFDALFTAQDHPVRDIQDTYFVGGEAEKGKLPLIELVKKIRQVHEDGGKTGSTGWQYEWDEEEAKKNVLRTHTTVLTAKTLSTLKKDALPAKFFALGKNFRNEAIDWKHLNEFNQTEGIVVDKNANFTHLLGYLRQFFGKMGFPQARFRPAFFPYTSPSVEIDVFHPLKKEWVEFGGAGMLRPEVVVPLLGEDIPVLAWGPGFDRTIMEYWNIADMRELYKNDIKQLREMKKWLK